MDAQQQAERLGHHSANREARPCQVPWAASLRPLQEAIDIGERMRDAARAKRAAVAASASLRPQAGRGDGARAEGTRVAAANSSPIGTIGDSLSPHLLPMKVLCTAGCIGQTSVRVSVAREFARDRFGSRFGASKQLACLLRGVVLRVV